MKKTIHCVIKGCTWSYTPTKDPLVYPEISTQGHKALNEAATAEDLAEYISRSIGALTVEAARKVEAKLQGHLENHSVMDWLETLAYYKELATK